MKRTIVMTGVMCGGLMLATGRAAETAKAEADVAAEVKVQTTCPVMGGKIKQDLYVDVEGKRIYVCCKGCIAPIKKDPAKYIKKLEDDGVTVESVVKAQTTCPVMGGKIKQDLYVDVEGKRIYVCCKGCIAPIKKDPAKYIKKLEDDGVAVESTPAEAAGK